MMGTAMTSIGAVIRREYLQRVRSKWFLVATIAGPLLMGALFFVPVYLDSRNESTERDLVVTDATDRLADRVASRLEDAGYTVRVEPWSEAAVEQLSQQAIDLAGNRGRR